MKLVVAVGGASRTTSTSLRRSFSITSAARPTRSSEMPWAIRARPPVEQGITTIASQPADPEANGARKSRRPYVLNAEDAGTSPISCAQTSLPAPVNTRPTSREGASGTSVSSRRLA